MNRLLIALLSLSLLCELIFSFYYSNAILNQNINLTRSKQLNTALNEKLEVINKQLSENNSLQNINKNIDPDYKIIDQELILK